MSKEIKNKAIVKNRRLLFKRPKLVDTLLDGLEGKEVDVTISEVIKEKTSSQLGYYFGGIIRNSCMQSEIFGGWSFDEIDDLFRREFLSRKKEIVTTSADGVESSIVKKVTQSIADLDTKEMSTFTEKVLMYCSKLGIYILDPEEYKQHRYTNRRSQPYPKPDF